MAYKPTGRPPGRPRKNAETAVATTTPDEGSDGGEWASDAQREAFNAELDAKRKALKRGNKQRRLILGDPAAALHKPPRFGVRRREVGSRPILHPNVIKG